MNAIVFGRDKGEKSEDFCLLGRYICQGILFICSHITVVMVSPLCWLFSSFTDDKDDTASCHCTWYIYHYIVAIYRFYQCVSYVACCTSRSKITLKMTTLFFVKWQSPFFLLLAKSEKIIFWRSIFRASRNLSDLFPLSLPNTIKFIPSGAKTQKKEIIPYPRCGFGACLRCR